MADFSLITNHPNCEEIISKLVSGTVPKEVSRWLKLKYPNKDQKHLNLTIKLLKDFVNSQYLDTYNQFTNDLVDTKNNKSNSYTCLSISIYSYDSNQSILVIFSLSLVASANLLSIDNTSSFGAFNLPNRSVNNSTNKNEISGSKWVNISLITS